MNAKTRNWNTFWIAGSSLQLLLFNAHHSMSFLRRDPYFSYLMQVPVASHLVAFCRSSGVCSRFTQGSHGAEFRVIISVGCL